MARHIDPLRVRLDCRWNKVILELDNSRTIQTARINPEITSAPHHSDRNDFTTGANGHILHWITFIAGQSRRYPTGDVEHDGRTTWKSLKNERQHLGRRVTGDAIGHADGDTNGRGIVW